MNRALPLFIAALLLLVTGCGEREDTPQPPKAARGKSEKFDPQISHYYKVKGKAGDLASAIAIGDGASFMGLYVYDKYGNCVAWDDEGILRTRDDLAVEWQLKEDGSNYTVEVKNNGSVTNECRVTVVTTKGRS